MKVASVIGSYIPEETPASRLDARVKIVLLLAFTVAVFLGEGPLALLVWAAMLALSMHAAHMGAGRIAAALRPATVVLVLAVCANLISCDGTAEVELVGPVGLSISGGARGLSAIVRIILLVGGTLVISASTTSTELADAFVRMLSPLSHLGVNVAGLGCALSIALRFVPIVAEEFQRIRLAQRARGVDFDAGGLFQRARAWVSVFAPLIIALFRRADRLSDSMEARCYAGGPQTPSRALGRTDRLALVAGLAAMVAVVLLSWML